MTPIPCFQESVSRVVPGNKQKNGKNSRSQCHAKGCAGSGLSEEVIAKPLQRRHSGTEFEKVA